MKKLSKYIIILLCVLSLNFINIKTNSVNAEVKNSSKSSILLDYNSKTIISSKNEKERLPIASMTKIALLDLCFESISNNQLSLDEYITVSENAKSMGGSQVFLESGQDYLVKDLIKSVVVASANDASVALAEKLYGSEQGCVEAMNNKVKELGLNDTNFNNCTGLPTTSHYSCAYDMAIIFSDLIKHDKYFDFSTIWMDKIDHKSNSTEIVNTNKLVKFYNGCDGGKTGFTNEAGFCLTATAKRGNMRLISVVIGSKTSKDRFLEVSSSFDYGFNNFTNKCIIEKGVEIDKSATIIGGKKEKCKLTAEEDFFIFCKKNSSDKIDVNYELYKKSAPIKKGDKLGEISIFKNDVLVKKINLVSIENVNKMTYFDYIYKVINNF